MKTDPTILEQEIPELYDEQIPVIEKLMEFVEANVHNPTATGFVVMPGGSGKTVVFSHFIKRLNGRAIVLSPTLTISDQNLATMRLINPGIKVTVYNGEAKDLSGDVIYITYHSFMRMIKRGDLPRDFARVIIYDEGHKALSEERSKIPDNLDALHIAFTATDKYSELKSVENIFKTEIYRMSLKEAILLGILLPLRGFVVDTNIDLRSIQLTNRNQLDENAAEKHLNILARNKIARDFYLENFKGIPAVAFCINVNHSIFLAEYFNQSGIPAAAVHSRTTKDERKEIYRKFNAGELDVLCSRDVLTEGWNSQRVTVDLNLRPTYSWVVAEQRACRVIRPFKGKTCGIVVEFEDRYSRKDQPIYIHHLFEQKTFTQGGYVHAPYHQMKAERKALENNIDIQILNNLKVSSVVRQVVSLNPLISDSMFEDRDLIKDILLSRTDVDYSTLPRTSFLDLRFNHSAFRGNGKKLLVKCLGGFWYETKEDYELFIAYVLGEYLLYKFLNFDNLETGNEIEEVAGDESLATDAVVMNESLSQDIQRVLSTLTEREQEIVALFFGLPYLLLKIQNYCKRSIERVHSRAFEEFRDLNEHELLDIQEGEKRLQRISQCLDINRGLELDEIGESFNLTRERVRQIKDKALQRMRYSSRSRVLAGYMDYLHGWHESQERRRENEKRQKQLEQERLEKERLEQERIEQEKLEQK